MNYYETTSLPVIRCRNAIVLSQVLETNILIEIVLRCLRQHSLEIGRRHRRHVEDPLCYGTAAGLRSSDFGLANPSTKSTGKSQLY